METKEFKTETQLAEEFLSNVSDQELEVLVNASHHRVVSDDHIIRKFIANVFSPGMSFQSALMFSYPYIAHECLMRMKAYKQSSTDTSYLF